MNRKFRELIPLFAIALMIIGAVALLIVMNSDSSKKKTTKKTETKTVQTTEIEDKDNKKDEEVSKPIGEVKEETTTTVEETKTTETKTETETKVEVKDETNSIAKKVNSVTNQSYISSMVNNILGNAGVQGSTTTQTTTTTTPVVTENKQPIVSVNTTETVQTEVSGTPVKPVPTVTTTPVKQPAQQTITQSVQQTSKATAYVIKKSVNINGYTVAITSQNSLICYNPNTKVIISADDIPSTASLMTVYYDKIYIYVPTQQLLKVYSVNSGILRRENMINISSCRDFVVTQSYAFILREDDRIYAHKIVDGQIEQSQSGFTRESGGMESIESAQGNRITAKTNQGSTYTYTFNGVNFLR